MADKSYKLTLSLSDGTTLNAGTITAPQGPSGANGVTFTPSVSSAGVLSWTNNGGLTNPTPISIKGPKGDDAVITESDVAGWGFTKNAGTITGIKMNGSTKGTSGVVDLGTVLTAHQDISGKQDKLTAGTNISISGNTISATVPTKTSQLTNDSGFTTNVGTITGIKMNGVSKGTSGVVDLGTVLTAHQDISGKANLNGGNTLSGTQIITGFLDIRGTAAEKHLKTCGIGGSDGNGNSSDLYLQYSSDFKTIFGKTGNSSLNADGSVTIGGNVTAENFNSRFSLQSVPYGTAIGANANLNTTTYLKVGNYYCSADNTVATLTNCPTKQAFMMTVYSPLVTTVDNETTGQWVYRVRKLMTYTGEEYVQPVNSGSTAGTFTYGTWRHIAKTSDIPDVSGKQDKLTAGSNISISGNTISAIDTGMVGVDVVGGGNAITGAAYSASTRLLTLTKGATYATTDQIPTFSLSGNNLTITL